MERRQCLESWLMTGRMRWRMWRRWPRPCNEMQLFFLAPWLRHVLHTSRQTLKMRQHFGQLAAWTDCLSAHAHLLTHTHSLKLTHVCTHTHTHTRIGQLRPRAIAPSLSSPFRCQLSLMYPARSGHASCLWPAFCVFVFVQRKVFRSAPDWLDMTAGMCGRRFQESQDRYVA